MNELERLAAFMVKVRPESIGAAWQAMLREAGDLDSCDPPHAGDGGPTLEWPLPTPWPAIRLPNDMGDVEGTTSQETPRRVFQNHDGDTLQLFFLPAGLASPDALFADPDIPGSELESRCGVLFDHCALILARWRVDIFGVVASLITATVLSETGELIISSINSSDDGRTSRMVGALWDLAHRGVTPLPTPEPGAKPQLAVRFHSLYGERPVVWELSELRPADMSYAEKEGRDALEHYSLDRVRTYWSFPKDVDPALERIHEEEVREYAEEIVVFRRGEREQNERQARSTMLTFVIENSGLVEARDIRVKLTFPPHVMVGSFGTLYAPRIQPPEHPQIFQVGPGFLKQRRKRITRTLEIGDLPQAAREDSWDSYAQHPDGGLTVTYRVDRVKARAAPNLTRTCLMFRSWKDVAPLSIAWEVSGADVPPARGTLEVGVRIKTLAEQDAENEAFRKEYEAKKQGKGD